MKLMFASDIHGSSYFCERMIECFKEEKAEKLVILGDILYHGPRNELPKEYNPKKVIDILNSNKEDLLVVRGNCDAEVEQMVLEFPVMADYIYIMFGNKRIIATHGHKYSYIEPMPLNKGDIFIQGHTHLFMAERIGNNIFLNPGSVSLPKENNPNTYAIMEDDIFMIKDMDGNVVKEINISEI